MVKARKNLQNQTPRRWLADELPESDPPEVDTGHIERFSVPLVDNEGESS